MVFLSDAVEDDEDLRRIRSVLEHYKGDKKSTQTDLNTYVVNEMFGRRAGDTTEDEDALLAQVMVETWKSKLEAEYPRRAHVQSEGPDNVQSIAVVFWVDP